MLDNLVQISPIVLAMVPVLMGIAQFAKTYEYIPSRWIPLTVVVLGIVGAEFLTDLGIVQAIYQGLIVGLMAMGVFTGGRATVQG